MHTVNTIARQMPDNSDTRIFLIIWPETKRVSAAQISSWYRDAVANGEVDDTACTDAFDQARELDSAGLITLGNNGKPVTW